VKRALPIVIVLAAVVVLVVAAVGFRWLNRPTAGSSSSSSAATATAGAPQVTETVVTDLHSTTVFRDNLQGSHFPVAISPDWKHVALVREVRAPASPPGALLEYDGAAVKTYAGLSSDAIVWSTDGGTYGYTAAKAPGQSAIVVGGTEYAAGDIDGAGPLVLSRDGKRWAKYRPGGLGPGKPRRLLVDGKDVEALAEISDVRFAPGDNRLVYRAGGRWVLEGLPPQPYHLLEQVLVTADGKTFIFHEPVPPDSDAGGNRLVVAAAGGGAAREYAGGYAPVLSPDGSRYAFRVQRDGKVRVVVDGTEGAAHDEVQSVGFSPDGKHVFYRAADTSAGTSGGTRAFVLFLDGAKVASSAEPLADPVFGAGNSAAAWWSDEAGRRVVYFNGKAVAGGSTAVVPLLAVSRDGNWLGCYAGAARPAVYGAAGQSGPGSQDPDALFARPRPRVVVRRVMERPDPSNIRKVQRFTLVVNEHPVGTYDFLVRRERPGAPAEQFHVDDATHAVTAYGVRGNDVVRVEVK
jgi:hypothetical protein